MAAKKKSAKVAEVNYDEIYKNWDFYPNCKINIPGESMWGKELPEGLFGINNMPLHTEWQWQDIVRSKTLGESEADVKALLVHRRWKHKRYFDYEVPKGQTMEQLQARRQSIVDALRPLGHPGFWSEGIGYLLIAHDDITPQQCWDVITKALAAVGVKTIAEGDPE